MKGPALPRAVTHHLLLALVATAAVRSVAAHGWIKQPASRNLIAVGEDNFYQQMSLNRKGGPDGICGGLFPGDTRFSVGGQFAKRTIAAKWTAGSTVEIAIQIWTNHWGRFELRLCPLSADSDEAEKAELSEDCLSQHQLTLADGSGPWYFLKGGNDVQILVDAKWKLPDGVTCERCVLQWRWVTGHMCLPPDVDVQYAKETYMPWPTYCGSNYLEADVLDPEKFWNCADVQITGDASSGTSRQTSNSQYSRKALQPVTLVNKDGSDKGCGDNEPPMGFSCKMQKAWGKCDSAWMVAGGFCKQTCGRCGGGGDQRVQLNKANAPVTLEKASADGAASTDIQTMSGAKTMTIWAQCGGKYGGDRCMSKPDGSARCDDAAWGWVRCPAASSCKRLNYGFWQCQPVK